MSKKGMISLEALVKFIPAFLIALVGVYVLFTLWGSFFAQESSPAQNDLARVFKNINSLINPVSSDMESIDVFTSGTNYTITLFPPSNTQKLCSGRACICVAEKQGSVDITTKCEVFFNDKCENAKFDTAHVCVSREQGFIIYNAKGTKDFVTVSRTKDGVITISPKKVQL